MSAHTNAEDPLLIEVRLFGGPMVLLDGEAVKLSTYQSYFVALVFGHGEEGISRSRLIDFLWDEPDGPSQRHRLSQLLHVIMKKCGRKIIRDNGGFLLSDLAGRSCDLTRVLQSVRKQDFEGFDGLRVADFLSRLEKTPTVGFESWRESTARQIEDRFTGALRGACSNAEAEARWSDLGALLSVAVNACPPTEDFLQRSIRHLIMVDSADQVPQTVSNFAARWERAHGTSWVAAERNLSTTMGHSSRLIREQFPV